MTVLPVIGAARPGRRGGRMNGSQACWRRLPEFSTLPYLKPREATAMHSTERLDAKTRAIEEALRRIGEPIAEAQAKNVAASEDCECKDGMFALAATRRQLFGGTGLVAAVGMTAMLPRMA